MDRSVHSIGDSFELELRGGGFARATTMPSALSGMRVVTVHHGVFAALGIPVVSDVPEWATCANCTHPNFRPKECPRRPDEDHFVVGWAVEDALELFARKSRQVCPWHSDAIG